MLNINHARIDCIFQIDGDLILSDVPPDHKPVFPVNLPGPDPVIRLIQEHQFRQHLLSAIRSIRMIAALPVSRLD